MTTCGSPALPSSSSTATRSSTTTCPPWTTTTSGAAGPSNHKAFGEATAILAGDALLTLAFDWIAEAGERAGQPARYLRAARALAHGAGVRGMVRGQARDLGAPPPTTLEALEVLHGEKTAALFEAALRSARSPPARRPTR